MLDLLTETINSFTYNGKNSADMGMIITKKDGLYGKPVPIVEKVDIPGRSPLIMNNKADPLDNEDFENIEKKYTCHVLPEDHQDLETVTRNIYEWLFASNSGYKRLEDTYEREFFRMAYLGQKMSVADMAAGMIGKIDIEFSCKPWKYAKCGEKKIELSSAGKIYNMYGFTAKPYIKIIGSGDVSLIINNRQHSFQGISEYIEVDSELMSAFKGLTPQNNKMVSQLFPKLTAGENEIEWTGNITKIEIIPRWCCL